MPSYKCYDWDIFEWVAPRHRWQLAARGGSMAGTGKLSIVAPAFVVGCGFAAQAPTVAMTQIPFMIPNFNFGPQHYRGGSQHYSTRHSRHEEDKAPDKTAPAPDKSKERRPTEPTAGTSGPRQQQQTTSAPVSHDAAPSGGSGTPASPPPATPAKQNNDDQPAFAPARSRRPPPTCPARPYFARLRPAFGQVPHLAFSARAKLYARDCRR